MNFINILVHSAEDLNFRVHLQFEFSQLGLDDHLNVRQWLRLIENLVVAVVGYLLLRLWSSCTC